MGVEYRHFLVVDDASWMPDVDTATRVENVLRRWSLIDQLSQTIDLSGGRRETIAANAATAKIGAGVAFIYAGVHGAPVERIAGPSYHESGTADRYTMRTSLVLGSDYRIQWSSESIYFELVTGPTTSKGPVTAYEEEEGAPYTLYAESFPSEGSSPPVVKIHVEEHAEENVAWSSYRGFWRGALVIDFGKDLPSFCEGPHALPARDFVADVAEAFRGRLVEVGEFY